MMTKTNVRLSAVKEPKTWKHTHTLRNLKRKAQRRTHSLDTVHHIQDSCTACMVVREDSQDSPSSCSSPGYHRSTANITHIAPAKSNQALVQYTKQKQKSRELKQTTKIQITV